MYYFVAFNTKGQTVINIEREFWILREWLYMVRVKFCASLAAFLACVVISIVNGFAPLLQFAAHLAASCLSRLSALPVSRVRAYSEQAAASSRAEFSALICAIKFFSARLALARLWRITNRPTSLRTILGVSIRFILKLFSTYGAFVNFSRASMLAPDCVVARAFTSFLLFVERVKLFSTDGTYIDLLKACAHVLYYSTLSPFCVAVILESMATAFPDIVIERIE